MDARPGDAPAARRPPARRRTRRSRQSTTTAHVDRARSSPQKAVIIDELVADLHLRKRPNNASLTEARVYNGGAAALRKAHRACGDLRSPRPRGQDAPALRLHEDLAGRPGADRRSSSASAAKKLAHASSIAHHRIRMRSVVLVAILLSFATAAEAKGNRRAGQAHREAKRVARPSSSSSARCRSTAVSRSAHRGRDTSRPRAPARRRRLRDPPAVAPVRDAHHRRLRRATSSPTSSTVPQGPRPRDRRHLRRARRPDHRAPLAPVGPRRRHRPVLQEASPPATRRASCSATADEPRLRGDLEAGRPRFAARADRDGGAQVMFLDYDVQGLALRLGQGARRRRGAPRRIFQYPHGRGASDGLVRHEPNHDNHLHVRFKCRARDTSCR